MGALPPNPRPAGGLACGAIFKQQLFLLCTVCVCAVIRQTCLHYVFRRRIMLPYLDSPGREALRVLRCLHALQHQVFIEVLFALCPEPPPCRELSEWRSMSVGHTAYMQPPQNQTIKEPLE